MAWNNVKQLPWFWGLSTRWPSRSSPASSCLGAAAALGWFMFRGSVTGVYRGDHRHWPCWSSSISLIIDQQPYTGGFNGITDLAQLTIVRHRLRRLRTLYILSRSLPSACRPLVRLRASRTKNRPHPAGHPRSRRSRPVFRLRRSRLQDLRLCDLGGDRGPSGHALYDRHGVRFADLPRRSDEPVRSHVVRRRRPRSLVGAFLGAILVTGVQGALSESKTFLDTWTLVMGVLFVLVVLFLPRVSPGWCSQCGENWLSNGHHRNAGDRWDIRPAGGDRMSTHLVVPTLPSASAASWRSTGSI